MSGMCRRQGSRRAAAACAGAVAAVVALAGCGSRQRFETVAPPLATVPPTVVAAAAPAPAPAPPPTLLAGEDLAAVGAPQPAPSGVAVVGRMVVPRLGLDTAVYAGDTLDVLAHGPGHRVGSALPGQVGNVVVAGHRTTYSRPFRDLDALEAGDTLTFETATGVYRYEFAAHDVVSPSQGEITDQPYGYVATLYACHPPGSARQRIVAYFRLASAPEVGQPDPTTVPVVPLPFA